VTAGLGTPSAAARLPRGRGAWIAGAVLGVALVAVLAVVFWPSAGDGDHTITVGTSNCGTGWTDPRPGEQTLTFRNTGNAAADVQVVEVGTGQVFGEIEGLAAGTTRPLRVALGGGGFAVRCAVEDQTPILGPAVRLAGAAATGGIVPVTENDLADPLAAYRDYLRGGMDELVRATDALRDTVHGGDLAAVRAAWLPAHLDYQRLGAAYDAFGDAGHAIDGGPDGHPDGVADPGFTGFRRLEYGLWHGEQASALTPVTDQLADDVHGLRNGFDDLRIDPRDLGLRGHEILEDTVRQTLTGHDDQGSGTGLATARANLDGTRALLAAVRPVLAPRYPRLSEVDKELDRTQALLDSSQGVPLSQLSTDQRQHLNGALNQLVEDLAPVAVILEPRRTQ
jgi:iron uptake system component EfeO